MPRQQPLAVTKDLYAPTRYKHASTPASLASSSSCSHASCTTTCRTPVPQHRSRRPPPEPDLCDSAVLAVHKCVKSSAESDYKEIRVEGWI